MAFAEEDTPVKESPILYFYAVNAGYKNDISSQNYDFFELRASVENLDLSKYKIIYTNSAGNEAGTVDFLAGDRLSSDSLIFGAKQSPQFAEKGEEYVYDFGSAGLASTSGKLSLFDEDLLVDEVCWGKAECSKNIGKFSSAEDSNFSLVLNEELFEESKYYPEISETILHEEKKVGSSCKNLRITEVYSFYEISADEQFVEIYNSSEEDCVPADFSLRYKNKNYSSGDIIEAKKYYVFRAEGLVLTKNPTTSNEIQLVDSENRVIDSMSYPHGQKAGLSYALIDDEWALSYDRTPGEANVLQKFRDCEEGKVINEETGNCVIEETKTEVVCEEGKYLNPETGRCKKIEEETTLAECAEGYERNPETNRCRKIQTTDTMEYAPKTSADRSFSAPKRFALYGVVVLAIVLAVGYVVYQYRQELLRLLRAIGGFLSRKFGIRFGRRLSAKL